MTDASSAPNVPDHVDKAVRSVANLHSQHRGGASTPQRAVNRISAFMARPLFLVLVVLGAGAWIAANTRASMLGSAAIDPPPFLWLEAATSLFSLFVVMLVLVAQKHEDELNAHRDTLTLELAILSEHKIAKVIQLLEELRRDSHRSRTGWIRRRSKWPSRPTLDRSSRRSAKAINGRIARRGTNVRMTMFLAVRV
jgi:uncharacterized membrane protein